MLEAQADDLLHPHRESVEVSARDAEHIKRPHGNLNEQDAAALEIGEKHLDGGIRHEDDAEYQHKWAGYDAEAEMRVFKRRCQTVHSGELVHDLLPDRADAGPRACDPLAECSLQGDGKGIEPHGYGGEQRHGHETLERVERRPLYIPSAGRVFDAALKGAHHNAGGIERPAQLCKKAHDALYPREIKDLDAHVPHLCEEVGEEADDLREDPVQDIVEDGLRDEIPDKNAITFLTCKRLQATVDFSSVSVYTIRKGGLCDVKHFTRLCAH